MPAPAVTPKTMKAMKSPPSASTPSGVVKRGMKAINKPMKAMRTGKKESAPRLTKAQLRKAEQEATNRSGSDSTSSKSITTLPPAAVTLPPAASDGALDEEEQIGDENMEGGDDESDEEQSGGEEEEEEEEGDDDEEEKPDARTGAAAAKTTRAVVRAPTPATQAAEPKTRKKQEKLDESLALIQQLGIDLHGGLKEKIEAYAKAMIEQDVTVLKKVHLPALFTPQEMSSLWQMLKGWVAKASPTVKSKWNEIQKMNMSHGGGNGKNEQKMAILNLALVRKMDWEEMVVEMSTEVSTTNDKEITGTWAYRGELERQVGKSTAKRWIESGKWEKGYDSDDESMYRKVQKSDREKRSVAARSQQKKTGTGDLDDFEKLQQAMMDAFNSDRLGTVATKKSKREPKDPGKQDALEDAAQAESERLKEKETGGEKEHAVLAVEDLELPDDAENEVIKAKVTIKKASGKLQDKKLEVDSLIISIGKKPDAIAAVVIQQLKELKTQMAAHQNTLTKFSIMKNTKVRVENFKHAATTAADMLEKLKKLRVCAKPHIRKDDDAKTVASSR